MLQTAIRYPLLPTENTYCFKLLGEAPVQQVKRQRTGRGVSSCTQSTSF